jgi:F0F1-type ATP synthase assembly protein I
MASEGEGQQQRIPPNLVDILQDAEDSYSYLRKKYVDETRLEVVLVSIVVWVATLLGLGIGSLTVFKNVFFGSPLLFIVVVTLIAAVAGIATYAMRRRRRFKFAELGVLLGKLKGGQVSSEDGLKLMEAMHQARLEVKKGKLDSAFVDGVFAFILVGLFGLNAAIGLLAGVIVYLYFRFEALREYEKEEERYQNSKREFLQSL